MWHISYSSSISIDNKSTDKSGERDGHTTKSPRPPFLKMTKWRLTLTRKWASSCINHRAFIIYVIKEYLPKVRINYFRENEDTCPVSLLGKIKGPIRWSPKILAQMFTEKRCWCRDVMIAWEFSTQTCMLRTLMISSLKNASSVNKILHKNWSWLHRWRSY